MAPFHQSKPRSNVGGAAAERAACPLVRQLEHGGNPFGSDAYGNFTLAAENGPNCGTFFRPTGFCGVRPLPPSPHSSPRRSNQNARSRPAGCGRSSFNRLQTQGPWRCDAPPTLEWG